MAQLRDKETSEVVFEGSPEEVSLMAAKIGADEVIFDDVGLGFDHESVLSARSQELSGLKTLVNSNPATNEKQAAQGKLDLASKTEKNVDKLAGKVAQRVREARARLED